MLHRLGGRGGGGQPFFLKQCGGGGTTGNIFRNQTLKGGHQETWTSIPDPGTAARGPII